MLKGTPGTLEDYQPLVAAIAAERPAWELLVAHVAGLPASGFWPADDNHLMGKRAVWRPFVPQRPVLNEAVGERSPVHAMGYRGRDVAEVFDQLYGKFRRQR
mgnify:CR=1 FL=1